MKILVCGGAGYIGSHMCRLLADAGHSVAVLDNLCTGHPEAVLWGELLQVDLADAASVRQALESFQPDGVMHFAARSLVGESVREPALYYAGNVLASLNLLNALRDHNRARGDQAPVPLIFSSTAAVYGIPQTDRLTEAAPTAPINAYGRTKLAVEMALADYWAAYRQPSMCLRYFNAAGADVEARIGEAHSPETHLIPLILEAAAGRSAPVTVFGEDYTTPDGTCIRDYIHVDDLCSAHLLGLQQLLREPGAHVLNLGNGSGFSVREVIAAAGEVIGTPVQYSVGARRPGDPPRLVADAARARDWLGWQPRKTDLHGIIESAWRWHRNRRY